MSFTCGHPHTRGGFGLQIGKPGGQDLYIGVKESGRFEPGAVRCLPFFRTSQANGVSGGEFLVDQAGPSEQNVASAVTGIPTDSIRRSYGWATDTWEVADLDLTFRIFTPFGAIPDPATASSDDMRQAIVPAIVAELTIDNSAGKVARSGVFAINFNEPGWLPLRGSPTTSGIAHRSNCGIVGQVVRNGTEGNGELLKPDLFCRWTVDTGLAEAAVHRLGTCPGLVFDVPAGERRTLRLALGCYLAGTVTTGIEAKYLYTRHFTGLQDVLDFALTNADRTIENAKRLDAELLASRLSADQKFLIAHATRSYYGSTQLLDASGAPLWIVNEGEYCMMNTLDLSVDQMFWELRHNPWVVRNVLDQFSTNYSYVDEVKTSDKTVAPGGLSFCHDMGAHNHFSPGGQSSYELPNLTGCFSYMTVEQLCNWSLLASTYYAHTGDLDWVRRNQHRVAACVESLLARSGSDGIVQFDSSRCGSGSEITTYDSLDPSLAQTRNNVYIAVKCCMSSAGLLMLSDVAGDSRTAMLAKDAALKAARAVSAQAGPDGVIPAVFEPGCAGHSSRILPAAEGLAYLLAWQRTRFGRAAAQAFLENVDVAQLVEALRMHTRALLLDPERQNLFEDGGIRLSSTSNNSWMSKIALLQHVARELFDTSRDEPLSKTLACADAAHVRWQTVGSAYWACCDQIVNGIAKGSRYYPRIVTTCLWLDEHRSPVLA